MAGNKVLYGRLSGLLLLWNIFGSTLAVAYGIAGNYSSPVSAPTPSEESGEEGTWYGNIQYLLNISAIGALCCVLLFLFVKLRSDLKLPGPASLFAKLLAVWQTTGQQIARTCGANAAQFLYCEGTSFVAFALISLLAIGVLLPINIYAGTVPMADEFSKTTVTHIQKGSPLLWVHVLFMVVVVAVVHFCLKSLEERLNSTRFHDGNLSVDSVSVFTLMIQGIPKALRVHQRPLHEYFEQRYPGKVYKVIIPQDLADLDVIKYKLKQVQSQLRSLQAEINDRKRSERQDVLLSHCNEDIGTYTDLAAEGSYYDSFGTRVKNGWKHFVPVLKSVKDCLLFYTGLRMEDRLRRLESQKIDLESRLDAYKEDQAQGAGIAFIIFKDVYTANKAIQDAKTEKKRPLGRFVSIMELQLEKSRWKVERAPPAADIYWHHLGTSTFSMRIRRVVVNAALLILLLFCSSPLAIISALSSAARIINAEAMDSAESWLAWIQSSSWAAALIFQFMPNLLIFVSMYLVIPAVLSYLSKFERHLTVSGEHRAALVKTFCFFLVNLIFLRAMLESSLEGALLRMGRCYMDGDDCKKIEQYMSTSFLSRSCLSSLAFLITSTFLGISYDLLAPIPWIKKKLQKIRQNDLLHLAPEENEVFMRENSNGTLEEALLSENYFRFDARENGNPGPAPAGGANLQARDLTIYPIARGAHTTMQTFDFAQYYAFNLTIFALALIYSSFAPLVVPVGASYFGYRYIVDKYNFLFVYRIRGFPAGNDGKLMATVLRIKRFCVVIFMLSMMYFFYVRGDSGKLQFVFTFFLLAFFCAKCGFDKLISSINDGYLPSILGELQTADIVIDGPTEYEVFAQPEYDLETSDI